MTDFMLQNDNLEFYIEKVKKRVQYNIEKNNADPVMFPHEIIKIDAELMFLDNFKRHIQKHNNDHQINPSSQQPKWCEEFLKIIEEKQKYFTEEKFKIWGNLIQQ